MPLAEQVVALVVAAVTLLVVALLAQEHLVKVTTVAWVFKMALITLAAAGAVLVLLAVMREAEAVLELAALV